MGNRIKVLDNDWSKNGDQSLNRFFYGYVVVAVCFAIQVVGWGIHNSFGIFFPLSFMSSAGAGPPWPARGR